MEFQWSLVQQYLEYSELIFKNNCKLDKYIIIKILESLRKKFFWFLFIQNVGYISK